MSTLCEQMADIGLFKEAKARTETGDDRFVKGGTSLLGISGGVGLAAALGAPAYALPIASLGGYFGGKYFADKVLDLKEKERPDVGWKDKIGRAAAGGAGAISGILLSKYLADAFHAANPALGGGSNILNEAMGGMLGGVTFGSVMYPKLSDMVHGRKESTSGVMTPESTAITAANVMNGLYHYIK